MGWGKISEITLKAKKSEMEVVTRQAAIYGQRQKEKI